MGCGFLLLSLQLIWICFFYSVTVYYVALFKLNSFIIWSVQFSSSVVADSLRLHGLQHARPPCLSPTPGACSDSCPIKSVMPSNHHILCCPLLLPLIFPSIQFFELGGLSVGASASVWVLPVNIQDWFPLGLTGLISLQSKGLSRVFSNTTVQKH